MPVHLTVPDPVPVGAIVFLRGALPPPGAESAAVGGWFARHVPRALAERWAPLGSGIRIDTLSAPVVLAAGLGDALRIWQPGVEEVAVLDRAEHALFIGLAAPLAQVEEGLALVSATARALALVLDGVVVDPFRQAVLPLDDRNALPPRDVAVEDRLRVFSTESGGEMSATTIGMEALGVPDVEVHGVPVQLLGSIRGILVRVAEVLVERVHGAGAGPLRLAQLEVEGVPLGLHHAEDGAIRLHAPDHREGDIGPSLEEVRLRLEGPREELAPLRDDGAVDRAVRGVRHELSAVRERFRDGLPPMARLYVRAHVGPVRDGGMWICVDRFTRHQVRGRLASQSRGTALRCGQRVRVPVESVVDWRIEHPDGRVEGRRLDAFLRGRAR